jgi:hypothetical protein
MRKATIAVAVITILTLFATTAALAQRSGYKFDPYTGDTYQWSQTPNGSTNVYGSNPFTGSHWNQTIEPNGNQRGIDSQGNTWQYNQQSGSYWNSNGHGCIGHGSARTCW